MSEKSDTIVLEIEPRPVTCRTGCSCLVLSGCLATLLLLIAIMAAGAGLLNFFRS